MRDGTLIKIRKMTDSHLANAIAMVERNADIQAHRRVEELLIFSSTIQGEQAGYSIDNEIDCLEEYGGDYLLDNNTAYQNLLAEQRHRDKIKRIQNDAR